MTLGERLLEGIFRGELLLQADDSRFDIRIGNVDLARLRFLRQELVADHLVENLPVHPIALVRRNRRPCLLFSGSNGVFEIGFRNRLTVDTREHLGQLGRHRLGGFWWRSLGGRCRRTTSGL